VEDVNLATKRHNLLIISVLHNFFGQSTKDDFMVLREFPYLMKDAQFVPFFKRIRKAGC
jgi:hypothetical protein